MKFIEYDDIKDLVRIRENIGFYQKVYKLDYSMKSQNVTDYKFSEI